MDNAASGVACLRNEEFPTADVYFGQMAIANGDEY